MALTNASRTAKRGYVVNSVRASRVHFEHGVLQVEGGNDPALVPALTAAGYEVNAWPDQHMFFGGVHAVAVQDDGQFEIVWETGEAIPGDAWSDFIPESAVLTADWTYPWVCGSCEEPMYGDAATVMPAAE